MENWRYGIMECYFLNYSKIPISHHSDIPKNESIWNKQIFMRQLIIIFTSKPASLVVVGGILEAPSGSTVERL